jgi:hypothetical protein
LYLREGKRLDVGEDNILESYITCTLHHIPLLGWTGHVALMGAMRNLYNILVGTSEGNRPLVRSRRRWEENILGKAGCYEHGSGPWDSLKGGDFLD